MSDELAAEIRRWEAYLSSTALNFDCRWHLLAVTTHVVFPFHHRVSTEGIVPEVCEGRRKVCQSRRSRVLVP